MGRALLGRDVRLQVRITPTASAWLDGEAARLGRTVNDIVHGLLDEAMMREHVAPSEPADTDEAEARAVEDA